MDTPLPCAYCGEQPEHRTKPNVGPLERVSAHWHTLVCVTPGCAGQTTRSHLTFGGSVRRWNDNARQKAAVIRNAVNTKPPLWRTA